MKAITLVTLVLTVFTISCDDGMDAMPETGSPIVSAPTQNPSSVTESNTTVVSDAVTPAANTNTSALNPAHGMPGHRCDIAVGQPLNSKPAAKTSAATPAIKLPTTNPSPLTTPVSTPAVRPVSNPAPVFTPPVSATGLNPPHGKPGHRCDIKVGEPLNSKSITSPLTPAITPTATAEPVAPGMNPKHGQPGHRCDIPVGAPLAAKRSEASATSPITPIK